MLTLPTYQDVIAAGARLQGHAHRTPVWQSRTADERLEASVFFKCENFQRMGAFKFRGAFNALSRFSAAQRQAGVISFSSGNHAQAIALSARALASACQVYGAEPLAGNDGQQSFRSGAIVHIETPKTIADGAQTQHLGQYTFGIIRPDVRDVVTASDAHLVEAMRFFAERMKMLVEPTGCLGFAAACHAGLPLAGKRVGVILSGGNVDLRRFGELLAA